MDGTYSEVSLYALEQEPGVKLAALTLARAACDTAIKQLKLALQCGERARITSWFIARSKTGARRSHTACGFAMAVWRSGSMYYFLIFLLRGDWHPPDVFYCVCDGAFRTRS